MSSRISFPPIRPEENLEGIFSVMSDYLDEMEEKYQREKDKRQGLERLRVRLDTFMYYLHKINLGLVLPTELQSIQGVPRNMRQKLVSLNRLMVSLDRDKYRGFFRRIRTQNNNLLRRALALSERLATRQDDGQGQLHGILPPPPRMTRSTTRFF